MLQEIALPDEFTGNGLSPAASQLIADAEIRIASFTRVQRPRIDNFVVCDFRLVDSCMGWLVDQGLACGDRFCEWGAGFGVVAMLAALRDLRAYGIEVEPTLVAEARGLAADSGIDVQFEQGSFIPHGGDALLEYAEDIEHIDTDAPSGYDRLDLEIADFEIIFAFPWPGEHRFWDAVFEHHASDGALLLTYHGIERLKLQRKMS